MIQAIVCLTQGMTCFQNTLANPALLKVVKQGMDGYVLYKQSFIGQKQFVLT